MNDYTSLKHAIWNINYRFDKMFLVFPAGRYFCYRTDADVYFLLDPHPDNLSALIRFGLNLHFIEASLFDKQVEIHAANLDEEALMQRILEEILEYTYEFPSRQSIKPTYKLYS